MSGNAPDRPEESWEGDLAGFGDVGPRPRPTPRDALLERLERLDVVAAQQDLQRACWEQFRELAGLPEDAPSGGTEAERPAPRRESQEAARRLSFTNVRRPYLPLPQP